MCGYMLGNSSINRNIKSFFTTQSILTLTNSFTSQPGAVTSTSTLATTISSSSSSTSSSSSESCNASPLTIPQRLLLTAASTTVPLTTRTTTSEAAPTAPSQYPADNSPDIYSRRRCSKRTSSLSAVVTSASSSLSLLSSSTLNKWQIVVLSIIILLLCCTSHVLAIRKGRLMTPSTFTALSGDLHVQIQFSQDEQGNDTGLLQLHQEVESSTTSRTTEGKQSRNRRKHKNKKTTLSSDNNPGEKKKEEDEDDDTATSKTEVENIITSTLVISKYIEEIDEVLLLNNTLNGLQNAPSISKTSSSNDSLVLQRQREEIVQNIPVYPDPRHNVTQVAVPCQTFMFGGLYEMQVISNLKTTNKTPSNFTHNSKTDATPTMSTTTTTLIPVFDERLRQTLDVRWPSAEMIVSPVRLKTYPDMPVEVTLRFPEVNCDYAWKRDDLPEFWLELIYCGKERTCPQLMPQNTSKFSILFAEQVRGFPKQTSFKLSCSLFGLAGNYAVQLRPMIPHPNLPITRRFLFVDWSEKYVFNVYARSIFPCDPHTGIGVLYEYPGCILEQGDRVRVYAKLRANVTSLTPPTSLHYIAEQRVVKNQYSLYFNCELFTEKYVEYCFVYVTQAISGAVADVRMDCVPTLPVKESDTGD